MKVLSIDFDYFIKTSILVRNTLFPQAEDIEDALIVKRMWDDCYKEYPEIKNIQVDDDELLVLYRILFSLKRKLSLHVFDSHAKMYDVIKDEKPSVLVNVDFHHDFYYMYGGKVTCANWLMKADQLHHFNKEEVIWVKRNDSETSSIGGEFPFTTLNNLHELENLRIDFDTVFLCLSPEWTPYHLNGVYINLVKYLDFLNSFYDEKSLK